MFLAWCPKSNILTPYNVIKFFSAQTFFTDFSRAYENMRGENLTLNGPYTINIQFKNHICVSEIIIQKFAQNQPSSNVAQIEVTYKSFNGTDLRALNGSTLLFKSSEKDPIIVEMQPRCGVHGMDIQIMKTDDNKNPKNVRVMVMGCYAPRKYNK